MRSRLAGHGLTLRVLTVLAVLAVFPGSQTALAGDPHVVEDGDSLAGIASDHEVAAGDLATYNGLDVESPIHGGDELWIPRGAGEVLVAEPEGGASTAADVPAYQQSRSLSCEYASVFIATAAFGNPIPEDDYIASTAVTTNPHDGFRGDIDGPWGSTDDYGIYAEALIPNLNAHGYVGEVSYSADAGYLMGQVDLGRPTVVWVATRGDTGFYEQDEAGNSFKLVPFEHVVVAYDYDAGGVYVSDPGIASYLYLTWDWFLPAWSVLDGMALSIYPAG